MEKAEKTFTLWFGDNDYVRYPLGALGATNIGGTYPGPDFQFTPWTIAHACENLIGMTTKETFDDDVLDFLDKYVTSYDWELRWDIRDSIETGLKFAIPRKQDPQSGNRDPKLVTKVEKIDPDWRNDEELKVTSEMHENKEICNDYELYNRSCIRHCNGKYPIYAVSFISKYAKENCGMRVIFCCAQQDE